jgi:hypothetical protein
MDKETRSAIERATQRARKLLEADLGEQLEGTFDVLLSGALPPDAGKHLTKPQRRRRDVILEAVKHKRAGGMQKDTTKARQDQPDPAVADYLRDAAFTTLNRFVALKMLEARELVQECVSKGDQSAGFKEFCGLAPGVAFLPEGGGYRLYLECIFDELSTEVKVLFDRRDPASVLWPRRPALLDLLDLLNAPDLAAVWREDETIGWVYQYFNGAEERRAMREASQAPRNSRELAVRNQFFTPRYVVQFLTDNTLGRIWCEMRRGESTLRKRCEYLVWTPNEVVVRPSADDPEAVLAVAWLEGQEVPAPAPWHLAHTVNVDDRRPREGWAEAVGAALFEGRANELTLQDLLDALCRRCRDKPLHEAAILAWQAEVDAAMDEIHVRRAKKGVGAPRVVRKREKKDPRDLRVLDPACGSGHFLLYAFDLLLAIYEEAWADEKGPASEATGRTLRDDYPDLGALRREVPILVLRHNLHGIDIDPRCAQIAALALWMRAQRAFQDANITKGERPRVTRTNVILAEPMPGEGDLVEEFAGTLKPPVLGPIFKALVEKTKLAGEMGFLLKLEEDLKGLVSEARRQFVEAEKEREKRGNAWLPGFEPVKKQIELDLSGITDESFFHDAEDKIRTALEAFAEQATAGDRTRRRLFRDDARQGVALLDAVWQQYDVVLMNPPFGGGSTTAKGPFELTYPKTKSDTYAAFVERSIELLHPQARLGAITSRTGFFLSSFQRWREEIILAKAPPVVFADLGAGVLDSAMVETAAYCLEVAQ